MNTRVNASRRGRKRRRRLLVVAVLFLATCGVGYFVALPMVARRQVERVFNDLGIHDHQFTLSQVSLAGMEITDLRLGAEPWLSVARVDVGFSLWTLLEGRVRWVNARELLCYMRLRDGRIDPGFVPSPRRASSTAGISLPFDSAMVEGLVVEVDRDGATTLVPVSGSVARLLSTAATSDHAGSISVGPAVFNDHALAQLDATFSVDSQGVTIASTWPTLTHALVNAEGRIDFSRDAMTATIDVNVPEFALHNSREIDPYIPALTGVALAGRFALSGRATYANGELKPLLTLRAADATIAHPDWPVAIASASAAITFDSLAPLRTRGTQRIDIARAMTGEIEITDAGIDFTMSDPQTYTVDAAHWTLEDGGVFHASPFALDLPQPRIATVIECANLDLNFWLELLAQGRADGQGRLSGNVTVNWNPQAYPRIQFVSGRLVADPPVGYIRTHDAERVGELLDQSNPQFTIDARLRVVKQRIIEALQDLGFTSLVLEFIPTGSDTTLRAEVKGKGRRGERPQEFSGLVINIGHFAERFQTALDARAAYESLRTRTGRPPDATRPAEE